jgi:hypothetical protein
VRLRVASEHFCFLHDIFVLIFLFLLTFLIFSSVNNSSFLYLADDDCKDILGKLEFVGGHIVKENHEFCSMEGEYALDELGRVVYDR